MRYTIDTSEINKTILIFRIITNDKSTKPTGIKFKKSYLPLHILSGIPVFIITVIGTGFDAPLNPKEWWDYIQDNYPSSYEQMIYCQFTIKTCFCIGTKYGTLSNFLLIFAILFLIAIYAVLILLIPAYMYRSLKSKLIFSQRTSLSKKKCS